MMTNRWAALLVLICTFALGFAEIVFEGDTTFSPRYDGDKLSFSSYDWTLTTEKWPCRVWRAEVSVDGDGDGTYLVSATHQDAMPDCDGPKDDCPELVPASTIAFRFRHQWRKRVLKSLVITRDCDNCVGGAVNVHITMSCPQPCPSALGHRGGLPPHAPSQFRKLGTIEGAEVDSQVTADRVIVLHHDARLGSTLKGDGRLCENTLSELQALPMTHKDALPTDHLMSLEEGLTIAKEEGFIISIDTKAGCRLYGNGGRSCDGKGCCMEAPKCSWAGPDKEWGYPEAAEAYLAATYTTETERQCFFAAFDADLSLAILDQDQDAMIMWLPSPGRNTAAKVKSWLLSMGVNMTEEHSFGLSVEKNANNFNAESIREARDEGFFFDIYTVTDGDMGQHIRKGPDTLETDNPFGLAEEVLKICPFRDTESKDIDISVSFCPSSDCSGHGTCEAGVCSCEDGYAGPDCQPASCVGDNDMTCSGHGECIRAVGGPAAFCRCAGGYKGRTCSSTCPSDEEGNECGGRGTCQEELGQCVCPEGFGGEACDGKRTIFITSSDTTFELSDDSEGAVVDVTVGTDTASCVEWEVTITSVGVEIGAELADGVKGVARAREDVIETFGPCSLRGRSLTLTGGHRAISDTLATLRAFKACNFPSTTCETTRSVSFTLLCASPCSRGVLQESSSERLHTVAAINTVESSVGALVFTSHVNKDMDLWLSNSPVLSKTDYPSSRGKALCEMSSDSLSRMANGFSSPSENIHTLEEGLHAASKNDLQVVIKAEGGCKLCDVPCPWYPDDVAYEDVAKKYVDAVKASSMRGKVFFDSPDIELVVEIVRQDAGSNVFFAKELLSRHLPPTPSLTADDITTEMGNLLATLGFNEFNANDFSRPMYKWGNVGDVAVEAMDTWTRDTVGAARRAGIIVMTSEEHALELGADLALVVDGGALEYEPDEKKCMFENEWVTLSVGIHDPNPCCDESATDMVETSAQCRAKCDASLDGGDPSCFCGSGFEGELCELQCPGPAFEPCNLNGECSDGECTCDEGYSGSDCSVICPVNNDNGLACSGSKNGRCTSRGTCKCESGFAGDDCSIECPGGHENPCTSHGVCRVDGLCDCDLGFGGNLCDQLCPRTEDGALCSGHGTCQQNSIVCVCEDGWYGEECDKEPVFAIDMPERFSCSNEESSMCHLEGISLSELGSVTCRKWELDLTFRGANSYISIDPPKAATKALTVLPNGESRLFKGPCEHDLTGRHVQYHGTNRHLKKTLQMLNFIYECPFEIERTEQLTINARCEEACADIVVPYGHPSIDEGTARVVMVKVQVTKDKKLVVHDTNDLPAASKTKYVCKTDADQLVNAGIDGVLLYAALNELYLKGMHEVIIDMDAGCLDPVKCKRNRMKQCDWKLGDWNAPMAARALLVDLGKGNMEMRSIVTSRDPSMLEAYVGTSKGSTIMMHVPKGENTERRVQTWMKEQKALSLAKGRTILSIDVNGFPEADLTKIITSTEVSLFASSDSYDWSQSADLVKHADYVVSHGDAWEQITELQEGVCDVSKASITTSSIVDQTCVGPPQDGLFTSPDFNDPNCIMICDPMEDECTCRLGRWGPTCTRLCSKCPNGCDNMSGACLDQEGAAETGSGGTGGSDAGGKGGRDDKGGKGGDECDCGDKGECVDGKCVCASGVGGDHCEITCPGIYSNVVGTWIPCSGAGVCDVSTQQCKCDEGKGGPRCDDHCPVDQDGKMCGEEGECNYFDNVCNCPVGRSGPTCEIPSRGPSAHSVTIESVLEDKQTTERLFLEGCGSAAWQVVLEGGSADSFVSVPFDNKSSKNIAILACDSKDHTGKCWTYSQSKWTSSPKALKKHPNQNGRVRAPYLSLVGAEEDLLPMVNDIRYTACTGESFTDRSNPDAEQVKQRCLNTHTGLSGHAVCPDVACHVDKYWYAPSPTSATLIQAKNYASEGQIKGLAVDLQLTEDQQFIAHHSGTITNFQICRENYASLKAKYPTGRPIFKKGEDVVLEASKGKYVPIINMLAGCREGPDGEECFGVSEDDQCDWLNKMTYKGIASLYQELASAVTSDVYFTSDDRHLLDELVPQTNMVRIYRPPSGLSTASDIVDWLMIDPSEHRVALGLPYNSELCLDEVVTLRSRGFEVLVVSHDEEMQSIDHPLSFVAGALQSPVAVQDTHSACQEFMPAHFFSTLSAAMTHGASAEGMIHERVPIHYGSTAFLGIAVVAVIGMIWQVCQTSKKTRYDVLENVRSNSKVDMI